MIYYIYNYLIINLFIYLLSLFFIFYGVRGRRVCMLKM